MPSLDELQGAVARFVRGEETAAPAQLLDRGLAPRRRLQVYRNNYRHGLSAALATEYPVIERLVGAACFTGLCRRYLERVPPAAGVLHPLGAGFAAFLAQQPELRGLDYLPDVARLERARVEAWHAADAAPPAIQRLAAVAPEDQGGLRLGLHPACRVLISRYPLLRIWQANQPGGDGAADLGAGGDALLVGREALAVYIARLEPGAAAFLQACRQGRALEAACGEAVQAEPGCDLGALLPALIRQGIVVEMTEEAG